MKETTAEEKRREETNKQNKKCMHVYVDGGGGANIQYSTSVYVTRLPNKDDNGVGGMSGMYVCMYGDE